MAILRSKPRERAYKLYDEKGLYLLVSTTAAKLWRLKYRVAGREKTLALGAIPCERWFRFVTTPTRHVS